MYSYLETSGSLYHDSACLLFLFEYYDLYGAHALLLLSLIEYYNLYGEHAILCQCMFVLSLFEYYDLYW